MIRNLALTVKGGPARIERLVVRELKSIRPENQAAIQQ